LDLDLNYCLIPIYKISLRNLEAKLDQEKLGRQRAETQAQEKARELSMLTVDNRQLQYRLDKIEADLRQESDKVSVSGSTRTTLIFG